MGTNTTPEETAADSRLHLAATYHREIAASVDRILENVFDWEHLPVLHDAYFTAMQRLEAGEWGWRVRLSRPPSTSEREQILRLEVDRARQRDTAIFEAGIGAGMRFWTLMTLLGPNRTGIEVRYYLPETRPDRVEMLGTKYFSASGLSDPCFPTTPAREKHTKVFAIELRISGK